MERANALAAHEPDQARRVIGFSIAPPRHVLVWADEYQLLTIERCRFGRSNIEDRDGDTSLRGCCGEPRNRHHWVKAQQGVVGPQHVIKRLAPGEPHMGCPTTRDR